MKKAVICPLGLSSPVVTAFVKYIGRVRDLVVLTTSDERVMQGFELVKMSMKARYPKTRIHEVRIPFDDVMTQEQNFEFMRLAGRAIKAQKEKYGSEVVYINVAGGRKNMCITLSILGQFLNVDGVFHIVTPDVKIINELLENLRPDIERIYHAESEEEKMRIYAEKERLFDLLMFPKDFEVIRIPTIPILPDYVKRIVKILFTGDVDMLTPSEVEILLRHGMMERVGSKVKVTEWQKICGVNGEMISICIFQVLGKMRDYSKKEFVVNKFKKKSPFSSDVLREKLLGEGMQTSLVFFVPESLLTDADLSEYERKLREVGIEDFECIKLPSTGKVGEWSFESTIETITSSIFLEILKKRPEKLYVDVSTGLNIYVIPLIEAAKRYLTYRKLERILQEDCRVEVEILFTPPIDGAERYHVEIQHVDVKAFFALPNANIDRLCKEVPDEMAEMRNEVNKR